MNNRTRRVGTLLAIVLIAAFVFSMPASASDMSTTEVIEEAGDLIQLLIPLAAGGITILKKDWEGTGQLSKSLFTTLGTTYALKYTINAERPNGGGQSFPSGHTSAAFSGASFLQKRYGWKYGIPAYVGAAFVGWSRVESNHHHAIDVVAGAAIGIVSSYIFTDAYEEGIVIIPFVGEGTYGLKVGLTF